MELTKEQIKQGLHKAYKEAGHNAYFGNGFEAGLKYAQEQFKILNIPIVSGSFSADKVKEAYNDGFSDSVGNKDFDIDNYR
jgi:hypothetical protein